ncbi:MAG: hypothetical protein NT007_01040 [Candidatus Kapabacteria bacterium]|nr:hypothetical protein [Candidatus Kapabacteria bacterium]
MNSSQLTFTHSHFRNYFFENFDVFFNAVNEERIAILNALWDKNIMPTNSYSTCNKPNWSISSYIFDENDGVEFFKGTEILIIELPKPTQKGEAHFIGLGFAYPPNVYSTIIPYYMLLEYIDENTAYYSEYKLDEHDNFEYFSINKPLNPNIQCFTKAIAERINKVSIGASPQAELDENCETE